VTDVANDRTAYRTQEATSLASAMVVFATAHPSPWATYTRDTVDAWRDLVVATAPAEAAYEIALATSQAASEIAQTVAENTFEIAVAQAGAQELLAATQAGLDQAGAERQADVAFAAATGQAAPQGLPGKQPQPPSPPPPPIQPGAPVPTPAQVTAETYGAGQGQAGTVGSTASVSMEAPDPNAVEPTRTPSNRGSSADGEENPYAYGSDKWFDWKIKRNGGKLRAGMSFNESNKRVAEDVRPVLEVTGDLCLSAVTGPYRDIIEIGTGKDMWDQRELSGTERTVQAALTFGIPLVGAVVGNFIEYGSKLARGVNRASRAGGQVEDVLQSGLRVASDVGPNSTLKAGNFGKAVRAAATHSADDATKVLRKMAMDEFGITAPIKVVDAVNWSWRRAAGITGFIDGKVAVRILNGPLDKIGGVMRHEMTHVMKWIAHPNLMRWSTSPLAPGSTIGRFAAEWQAHSIHTLAKSAFQGALREALSHPLQWGSDLIYIGIFGGSVYYATRPDNP
jgi:hypothetical protein